MHKRVLLALILAIVVVAGGLSLHQLRTHHHQDLGATSTPKNQASLKVATATSKPSSTTTNSASSQLALLDTQATTSEQTAIAKALDTACAEGAQQTSSTADTSDLAAVGVSGFFSSKQYVRAGKYAKTNTGCASRNNINSDDSDGGHLSLLQVNDDASWTIFYSGQMYPDCSVVDGQGIPATITLCDENGKSRAPN